MTRLLVIPAAGRGTRLGWHGPKVLYPVAGRPMLDHLLQRYATLVDEVVVVVAPEAEGLVRQHLGASPVNADCVIQAEPAGMLPAILAARPAVEAARPRDVWITWCDQIAISAGTVQRLASERDRHPDAALVFPTVRQEPPYIHFVRDASGRIANVLHRREGDAMPPVGESDAGLFALSLDAYLDQLTEYDRLGIAGGRTKERNFLPFIPWLAARATVRTFDLQDPQEAIGVNTAADRRALEAHLRDRA